MTYKNRFEGRSAIVTGGASGIGPDIASPLTREANASAYSASKAGVIGFTKSLGKELAKTAIRVNCVTPAAVRTAIFDQMSEEHIVFMRRQEQQRH